MGTTTEYAEFLFKLNFVPKFLKTKLHGVINLILKHDNKNLSILPNFRDFWWNKFTLKTNSLTILSFLNFLVLQNCFSKNVFKW